MEINKKIQAIKEEQEEIKNQLLVDKSEIYQLK